MRRWTRPLPAAPDRAILSHVWTTSTCYKPLEIERKDLVVAHWPSEVESTAPLDVLLRHGLWTPFGCPMSCKIRSIISATCDFTTKSDGIWPSLAGHILRYGYHDPLSMCHG